MSYNETSVTTEQPSDKPVVDFSASRQFASWLHEQRVSLGFSTYQSGKVFLVGHNDRGELSIFERSFERPMGMWSDGQTLVLSALYQIHRFENTLPEGQLNDGYDRLYVPRLGYVTGDLDVHDLYLDRASNRPVFVNTLFSCLATTSDEHSFTPVWQPDFITKLQPEDRCHLNGLAMRDNQPAFVTAVARSDVADGWREKRASGGIVIDVAANEICATGLSMPHSPRWHNERLWLANSGTGEFGYIDTSSGRFEAVAFCPGYIRGIALHGDYAVVGLSRPRNNTFSGLPLDDRLAKEDISARSGLYVIDLNTGATPHWFRTEGIVAELYDVVALPNVRRPSLVGFRAEQVRRIISIGPEPTP